MHYSRTMVARICRQYGQILTNVPRGIDPARLLWALSGNESSFGGNCTPRHEPGYCPQLAWVRSPDGSWKRSPGRYSRQPQMMKLTGEFGCLAHCSLGPWQVMAVNANGFSLLEIVTNIEVAARATIAHLARRVLPNLTSLREIADAYNSGNARDVHVPQEYIDNLIANYSVPLPKEEA